MLVIFSLIVLILFAVALAPYIGAFFSGVIFVVSLVATAPAIHIFVGRDIKERDHICDKMDEAKEKMDFKAMEMYQRHLKEAEEHVNNKINLIFILFIISMIALSIFIL